MIGPSAGTIRAAGGDDGVLDYFIVSRGIAASGASAVVDLETEAAPHRLVLLLPTGSLGMVDMLIVTKVGAMDRIIGPMAAPSGVAERVHVGL